MTTTRHKTESSPGRPAASGKVEKGMLLERLAAVAKDISSGLDLSRVLERVVQDTVELTDADGGTIALLDKKQNMIHYPYHYQMPEALADVSVPSGSGLAGRVMAERKPVVIEDYPSDPAHVPAFSEAGVKTILAVPLIMGDRPVGALGMFGKTPEKKFTPGDIKIAQAVADLAAVAIDNARMFEETNDRLRVQRELVGTATSIASGLDHDKALSQVVRHAAEVLRADAAMIAILDEGQGLISFPYAYNFPFNLPGMRALRDPRGLGIAGQVIRTGKPVIVNDYPSHPLSLPEFTDAGLKAVATVPLTTGGRVIGALGVMDTGSGREFIDDDLDILSIISTQAAVALENSRLHEELESSAKQLEQRVRERTEALSRMYDESMRKSRELEDANVKLQELDRLKTEFLANMSHELRTPLNAIIGFSKLLLDGLEGAVNEEQRHDLDIVHENGQELLRMIDDLLNIAKIEAGRVSLVLLDEDPGMVVSEAVMSFRKTAVEKGLQLDCHIPPVVNRVPMDKGKIRQVIMSLIGNALKFTKEGTVTVSLEQTPEETVLSVADTGIGLEADQREEVFKCFSKVAPAMAEAEGVGLGLTISKRFVEMHGGRIWVKSKAGGGSIFSFSIPTTGPKKAGGNNER